MTIKLPERTHFTFDELLKRWECSINDIRDLVVNGRLVPAMYFYRGKLASAFWIPDPDPDAPPGALLFEAAWQLVPNPEYSNREGFYYLRCPKMVGPLTYSFQLLCDSATEPTGEHTKAAWYECDRRITMADVESSGVFTMLEVARFESLANATVARTDSELTGKSLGTALRLIGKMAVAGWKVEIHADRMNNIGDLMFDLDGIVEEKTLRKWLKDAAEVLEPKRR